MTHRLACLLILALAAVAPVAAQTESPFAERVGRVMIEAAGPADTVTVNLQLPAPGYLAIESDDPDRPVTAAILDGDGRLVGTDAARVSAIDGATARLSAGPAGFPEAIALRFRPEMDVTEPNDAPDLAWPIATGEIFQAVLFPAGDVDHFAVSLDAPSILRVHFEDGAGAGAVILDGEGGETAPGQALPAGDYVLALRDPDKPHDGPRLINVLITAEPPDPPAREPVPVVLEPGRPAPVSAPEGAITALVDIARPGRFTVQARNLMGSPRFVYTGPDGDAVQNASPFLSPGRYGLEITGLSANSTGLPGFLTLTPLEMTDPLEPNDFARDAARLRAESASQIILEPESAGDWFQINSDQPVTLQLQLDLSRSSCSAVEANRIGPDGVAQPAQSQGGGQYLIWSGVEAGPQSSPRLFVRCLSALEAPATARLVSYVEGANPGEAPSVYVVGVELGGELSESLAAEVELAGGQFVEAARADQLSQVVESIAREAETRGEAPWRLVLILLAVALAAGGGYWRYRNR
jgi:hypothetical protein